MYSCMLCPWQQGAVIYSCACISLAVLFPTLCECLQDWASQALIALSLANNHLAGIELGVCLTTSQQAAC